MPNFTTIFITLSIAAACTFANAAFASPPAVRIVSSIPPIAFFARSVGDSHVTVSVMVPPGANPHTYEPKPSQLTQLSKADLYLKVGTGLEFELSWLGKLAAISHSLVIWDCSTGIELLRPQGDAADHAHPDPHVWLSPRCAIMMTQNIRDALAAIDPPHQSEYKKNADSLIAALTQLDDDIRRRLSQVTRRSFVAMHPAWGYFSRDYQLTQLSAEEHGKSPSMQDLLNVIQNARQLGAQAVVCSPQFSQKSAQTIAKEIKGKIVLVDPLDDRYFQNLTRLADALGEIK